MSGGAEVVDTVVRIEDEITSLEAEVGLLVVVLRVGRRAGRTLTVVVLVGLRVVVLWLGLLVGRRVGLGRLVVVVEGGGACFFLFLFGFLPPDEPNRSPNKSSPKRLNPV